jgi:glycosyltransferase involved in cell wall biosynthesis
MVLSEASNNPGLPRSAMPDLIVVGHAGFTAINRNVYVHLGSRGWRVELVIPRSIPSHQFSVADPARAEDPPIYWAKVKGNSQRFWNFDGLGEVLRVRRPRAVLLEGDPASVLAITLSRWARRNGIPLLCYTCENAIVPLAVTLFRARFLAAARTLRSLLMTRATRNAVSRVFVLCNASVESMKILGLGDRTFKMPLGFDPAIFHPDPEARALVRARHNLQFPVIAYIGRMVEGKGMEFLIEALGTLMNLEWHFLVDDFGSTGPGDYADQMRRRIAANPELAGRTKPFHADHQEIAAYMNAADVVVAPSCLPEQYGRVLAEAMACGKAVIASDAGAYPEVVGDCGIVVPQADAKALTAGLKRVLIDSSLRRKLGTRAAERALGALSLKVQVDIIDEHLREVLSGRPSGGSQRR